MWKNNNRFKKLNIKIKRKEKKRKIPQNCKCPMQRQRFMTTIKNVTEGKKEKQLINLIGFHSANKTTFQLSSKM